MKGEIADREKGDGVRFLRLHYGAAATNTGPLENDGTENDGERNVNSGYDFASK